MKAYVCDVCRRRGCVAPCSLVLPIEQDAPPAACPFGKTPAWEEVRA